MQKLILKALLVLLIATPLQSAWGLPESRGIDRTTDLPDYSPLPEDAAPFQIKRGRALYRSGQLDEALSVFRDFIRSRPDSPQKNTAYLFLARIFLNQNRFEEASHYLHRIPEALWGPEEKFIDGVTLVETGQTELGVQRLLPLRNAPLFEEDLLELHLALSKGKALLGHPLQALILLDQARKTEGDSQAVLTRAHNLLEDQLSEAELEEAAFIFARKAIGQDATLQLAKRALQHNDIDKAKKLTTQVIESPTPFPYRHDAIELLTTMTGTPWLNRDRIGVILPLSGRYAPFGELVKRGLELANRDRQSSIRFVYRDSAAEANTAEAAVTDLAIKERVIAIIGPLSGSAATTAAQRAQLEGVPMLALSHREDLPQTGDYIFRNSLTNRMQARALARHAVLDQGVTSFGVLAPDNRLGHDTIEIFRQEVKKLGGLVIDVEHYDENATDFREPILRLRGEDPNTFGEEREELTDQEMLEDLFIEDEPEFAPATFEALFIPDFADRVALIAPQLAFYGLDDIQLLGNNGWHSPDLLRMGSQFVEGAVIVDGFFSYSKYPFVSDFVNRYFEAYGAEPTILEAQAYDTAGIVLSLMENDRVHSRNALRLALSQLQNYPGVTGATSFDLQGEADKILFLLRIENGSFQQIN